MPLPRPQFCSIGTSVSGWISSPFNHLPLPLPVFVSITRLKSLLWTGYWMRQRSVSCRALSLSGDKMVIKTKSDTSNARLLLSFSAYCFFSPNTTLYFFPSTTDGFEREEGCTYGTASLPNIYWYDLQKWCDPSTYLSLKKLLIFRASIFSARKVSCWAVSVSWTQQYPAAALGGCRAILKLELPLYWVCSSFALPKSSISGAFAPCLPSHPLSASLNQNKTCCINYFLILIN